MSCTDPIQFETLVELWAGDLADAERVEEHLFSCDECAAASAQLDRLLGTLLGQIPPVVTRALRDRLEQRGLKIRDYAFETNTHGEVVFAAELDLLVIALRADLASAQRVDLEAADTSGQVHFAFTHVPFDASRGEVLVACQQHYRNYPHTGEPEFRVFAVEGGTRRQVGSYVIKHVWPPL